MIIKTIKQGLNIEADIKTSYTKTVTKFGTGAKIDCSKEYLKKEVIILIPKKQIKEKNLTKNDIKAFYTKKVTKFGTGAKIDCSKDYIGKDVIVLIL